MFVCYILLTSRGQCRMWSLKGHGIQHDLNGDLRKVTDQTIPRNKHIYIIKSKQVLRMPMLTNRKCALFGDNWGKLYLSIFYSCAAVNRRRSATVCSSKPLSSHTWFLSAHKQSVARFPEICITIYSDRTLSCANDRQASLLVLLSLIGSAPTRKHRGHKKSRVLRESAGGKCAARALWLNEQ